MTGVPVRIRSGLRALIMKATSFVLSFLFLLNLLHGQPTVEEIRKNYIQINGGREAIEAVNSLRVVGTAREGEQRYDFTLLKKRPNLYRLIIRHEGFRIHMGYDGDDAWRLVVGQGVRDVSPITGSQASRMAVEADFESVLVAPEQTGAELAVVGEEKVEGRNCYIIAVTRPDLEEMRIYLDKERYREIRVDRTHVTPGGERIESRSYFRAYRQIKDLWVAHHIETWTNGELSSVMEVDKVDFNVGAVESYFRMPEIEGDSEG